MCEGMFSLSISGLLGVRRVGRRVSSSSSSSNVITLPITPQLRDFVGHGFNRLWCKPFQHLKCDGAKGRHSKRPVILLHCLFGDADPGCWYLTQPRGGVIVFGLARLAA